jgi:hypothetical protein
MARYRIFAQCVKCGGIHKMPIIVTLEDGPAELQTIADVYREKVLPAALRDLNVLRSHAEKRGSQLFRKIMKRSSWFPLKGSIFQIIPLGEYTRDAHHWFSASHTGHTEAHRLIRDRHLRHVLNRARHSKNDEAAVAAIRRKMFCIIW